MSEVSTFLIEPFDIMLHATEEGVQSLQARFSTWLRTLNTPARFACWQMPATLDEKIPLTRAGYIHYQQARSNTIFVPTYNIAIG